MCCRVGLWSVELGSFTSDTVVFRTHVCWACEPLLHEGLYYPDLTRSAFDYLAFDLLIIFVVASARRSVSVTARRWQKMLPPLTVPSELLAAHVTCTVRGFMLSVVSCCCQVQVYHGMCMVGPAACAHRPSRADVVRQASWAASLE